MTTMIGYTNQFSSAALYASSEGKPVTNLALPNGDANSSWETEVGVREAYLTLDAGSSIAWRALLLARTNLTSASLVRWSIGTQAGVIPEEPTVLLSFNEGFTAPSTGTWSYVRATPSWRRKSDGTWEEVASGEFAIHHDASGNLLGHQLQRQLTNLIRNPRLGGGAAGSPGTAPTYCTNAVGGTSAQIAAVGSEEDGLPAVDWRVTGTTAGATNTVFFFETTTGISAVQNDLIYLNLHARILAGDLTNISSVRIGFTEQDSGGAVIPGGGAYSIVSVDELRLGSQRLGAILTAPSAACAYIRPYFQVWVAAAGAVEVTFRLSVPSVVKSTSSIPVPFVPITPPVGAPATSTRDADSFTYTPVEDIMVEGAMTVHIRMTLFDSQGVVGGQANLQVDDSSTSYVRLRPYTLGGTQWSDSLVSLAGSLIVDTPPLDSGVSQGSPCRYTMRLSADTGFNRWVGTLNKQVDPDVQTVDLNRIVINAVNGVFSGCIQELRVYNRKLTDGQCAQLSLDGTSYDPAGIAYDTGLVTAGVETSYGQSLVVLPSNVSGQYARCELSDVSNPDPFLRVGLAYAGGVWEPANGIARSSAFNPESQERVFSTRGGQDHIEPLFRRRAWQLSFDAMANSEAWTKRLSLEAASASGLNVLFIPNSQEDLAFAPVFGRLISQGELGYSGKEYQLRTWTATITERL